MKIKTLHLAAFLLTASLVLTGCGRPSQALPAPSTTAPTTATNTAPDTLPQTEPATLPTETVPAGILLCEDRESISAELADAIMGLRQPREMDVSTLGLEDPELDVKNIYYSLTS